MAPRSVEGRAAKARAIVGVIGHASLLDREAGAAATLRQLGADVVTLDLWDEPTTLLGDELRLRALVFEALDRPDLGAAALRQFRKERAFDNIGTLIAVTVGQLGRLEPTAGFDDFVLFPYVPAELYTRIRALEWQKSEFSSEERHKVGKIVVDGSAHEVTVDGKPVLLTSREMALLLHFCERRGRVLTREHLLANVWGSRYEGGARTVDIHVRRLRAKLGEALPLETLRGNGYKLRAVED